MRLVYLAGPFRGANSWEVECNVRRAEALALRVWQNGAACICPHTNTRFYQGAADDTVWLEGDLEILRRCDAVVATWDWARSQGAKAEIGLATRLNMPVFYTEPAADRGCVLPYAFYRWLATTIPTEDRVSV